MKKWSLKKKSREKGPFSREPYFPDLFSGDHFSRIFFPGDLFSGTIFPWILFPGLIEDISETKHIFIFPPSFSFSLHFTLALLLSNQLIRHRTILFNVNDPNQLPVCDIQKKGKWNESKECGDCDICIPAWIRIHTYIYIYIYTASLCYIYKYLLAHT